MKRQAVSDCSSMVTSLIIIIKGYTLHMLQGDIPNSKSEDVTFFFFPNGHCSFTLLCSAGDVGENDTPRAATLIEHI
ncbi:uncharacterized protein PHA67_015929 isoform 2-T4 [Liasis olivaceus]